MSSFHLVVLALCLVSVFFEQGAAIQCSVCDTESDGWECLSKPPLPQNCPGYDYCINVSYYTSAGKIKSFTRACSPLELPGACLPGVNKNTGEMIQACYKTCSTPGCNGDRSLHHVIDLLRRRRRR